MKKLISVNIATKSLMILFGTSLVFHLLVILRIIPFDFIWGGKLKTVQDMIAFESVSIISNALMLMIVLIKLKYLKINIAKRTINFVFWAIAVLFLLNTLGNLLSENLWETLIFTPLTLITSVFAARIALDN